MDLYIKPEPEVKDLYTSHSFFHEGDSGIDIFFAEDQIIPGKQTVLVDFKISCELRTKYGFSKSNTYGTMTKSNKSYFLLPRSSIYKTPLRLANSIGLIDAHYRGNIKAALDNISESDYTIKKGDRMFQLVSPDLRQFDLIITDCPLSETKRGSGGFGSTGTGTEVLPRGTIRVTSSSIPEGPGVPIRSTIVAVPALAQYVANDTIVSQGQVAEVESIHPGLNAEFNDIKPFKT
jgi:dUTP pyrophosphatase